MTGHVARRRAAITAVITAVIAMVATVLAPPALAGGAWDSNGPGSWGGGGQVGIVGGSGFHCGSWLGGDAFDEALYHKENGRWVLFYTAPYPNCTGDGNQVNDEAVNNTSCITGFLVYRFYGMTMNNPEAITRSRLNTPTPCETGGQTYSFAAQTSWDAHPNQPPGLPDWQRTGTSPFRAGMGLPAAVGVRENGYLTSGKPTQVVGSCTAISATNPLEQQWKTMNDTQRNTLRAKLGMLFWAGSDGGRFTLTGANSVGLSHVANYYRYSPGSWRDQSVPPAPDPSGHGVFLADSTPAWSAQPCATPWNFQQHIDLESGSISKTLAAYGTCVIPLITSGIAKFDSAGNTLWAYRALDQGFGERFSNFYDGKNKGELAPAWRDAMRQDYLDRYRALGGFQTSTGAQMLPAQPYTSETIPSATPVGSAATAANALASGALCWKGQKNAQDEVDMGEGDPDPDTPGGTPVPPPVPTPSYNQIPVDTARVLQSGGLERNRAEFRVRSSDFDLDCPGIYNCILESLTYDVDVTVTGGNYQECTIAGQDHGCLWRVVQKIDGSKDRDAIVKIDFYNATMPGTKIRFQVKNPVARYSYQVYHPGWSYTVTNPATGTTHTEYVSPWTETRYGTLYPTVYGTPTPLTKSGSTYYHDYPVISAVSVPAY